MYGDQHLAAKQRLLSQVWYTAQVSTITPQSTQSCMPTCLSRILQCIGAMQQCYLSTHVVLYRRAVKFGEARPGRLALGRLGNVQSDTTDNPVATGDCLLDCRPVLLNFSSLQDQAPGHEKTQFIFRSVFQSVFHVLVACIQRLVQFVLLTFAARLPTLTENL